MKRMLIFLLVTVGCLNLYSQYICDEIPINEINLRDICSRTKPQNSLDSTLMIQSFIPNSSSPTITIPISINVWRRDDGSGNWWLDCDAFRDSMALAFDYLNNIYSQNIPYSLFIPNTQYISDTKVRFIIDTFYYYNNSEMAYKTSPYSFIDYLSTYYPERLKRFNYNLSIDTLSTFSGCTNGYNAEYPSIVSVKQNRPQHLYAFALHMAHEFGHNFGLNHTYDTGECLEINHPEFLWDVFGIETQSWCNEPVTNVCFHDAGWNCDYESETNTCTNNLMGGNKAGRHISALQCGRIHRALSVSSLRNYAFGYSTVPFAVTEDQTIDYTRKMYQDIEIRSNATLYVKCNLELVDNARIIVHPGGRLVVDGGTLTSACEGTMWEGVFVEGDRTQPQHASLQGVVELRNGATIENARCAITTSSPDGNTSITGGIILAEDATFRNNAQAIRFLPYADYVSTNTIRPSYSQFKNCIFTIDGDNHFAAANTDFSTHVSLWDVTGIKFLGCTFENNADATVNRGRAIYTENAGYTVKTQCNMPSDFYNDCDCPVDYADYNTFSGFATAIDANTTGNSYAITIDGARFSNNGTGVLLNSTNYATVTRCDFDLSNSPVSTMRNITGLTLKTCTGFKVEGNLFHQNATSLAVTKRGIVASETGTGANSIYRNSFSNLSNGIYVVGNNGSLRNGLQFSCNTFENNNRDVNMTTSSTLSYSQGGPLKGADNTFSGTQDCSITLSSGASMNYYRSSGTNLNPYNPSTNLHLYAASPNGCASTLCSNDQISMVNASDRVRAMMQDSLVDLSALKDVFKNMHELNARYSLAEVLHQMDIDNLTTLFSLSDDLTEDADKAEYENYMAFNGVKMKYWPEATSEQIELLRNIAENNTGRSSEMAKGVLCFFFGECYEEEMDYLKTSRASYPKNPYQPFAEGCTWSVNNVKYFSSGDTLINNIIYTKIYKEEHNTPFEFNLSNAQYWGAFRNDTAAKKVYFFVPAGCYVFNDMNERIWTVERDTDLLFYDFSLNYLDTVQCFQFEDGKTMLVQYNLVRDGEMDSLTTLSDNSTLRGFHLKETGMYSSSHFWIEGVGDNHSFYSQSNHYLLVDVPQTELLCFANAEGVWFSTGKDTHDSDSMDCFSLGTGGDVSTYLNNNYFKIYPNPASTVLQIVNESQDLINAVAIYNNMGQCVLSLSMFDCKNTIDISNLPSGVYFIRLKSNRAEQVSKFIKID